jgi:hypothetical protein
MTAVFPDILRKSMLLKSMLLKTSWKRYLVIYLNVNIGTWYVQSSVHGSGNNSLLVILLLHVVCVLVWHAQPSTKLGRAICKQKTSRLLTYCASCLTGTTGTCLSAMVHPASTTSVGALAWWNIPGPLHSYRWLGGGLCARLVIIIYMLTFLSLMVLD